MGREEESDGEVDDRGAADIFVGGVGDGVGC